MSTKVTVNLPDETVDAIRSIAEDRGTTLTEALRQIIESQRFLEIETRKGNNVLIENPSDNTVRQVVFNAPPRTKNMG